MLTLTDMFSRNAMVSTSLFLITLLSAILDGFRRRVGCVPSSR